MAAPSVVVIGAGSAGSRHIEVIQKAGGFRVSAVSRRAERRRELESQGIHSYDAVTGNPGKWTHAIVATDTARHFEDARASLDAGMDVLVEKPMTATSTDAEELRQHARSIGRRIFVACNLRFSESLNLFRQKLGAIGAVQSVTIECLSYLPDWRPSRPYKETYSARAEDGGVLRDLIHEIDYAVWIYGRPKTLDARLSNSGRLGIHSEDSAEVKWKTAGHCSVSIQLDYLTKPTRRMMKAVGAHGTIEWDGVKNIVRTAVKGDEPQVSASAQSRGEMFQEQLSAFLGKAQSGWNPASAGDGVVSLAICDAARRASEAKNAVEIIYPADLRPADRTTSITRS